MRAGTTVYRTKIRPLLEYASPVWGGLPDYLANEFKRVRNRSLDIIGAPWTRFQHLNKGDANCSKNGTKADPSRLETCETCFYQTPKITQFYAQICYQIVCATLYTGGILQRLGTDVHSAVTAKTSTVL